MAKDDKEFGKWEATTIINNKISFKRYEHGFIIKKRKEEPIRELYHNKTSTEDMTDKINGYYQTLNNLEKGRE